jgi:hypothetical protein
MYAAFNPPPPASPALDRLDAIYRAVRSFLEPEAGRHAPDPNDPAWHQELVRAWHYMHGRKNHMGRRLTLLKPGDRSNVRVEGYVFNLNPTSFGKGTALRWGEPNTWIARGSPKVSFLPEWLYVNVTAYGVASIEAIDTSLGWMPGSPPHGVEGSVDAFSSSSLAVGKKLPPMPTITPSDSLTVRGSWAGVQDMCLAPGVMLRPKGANRKKSAEPGPEFKLSLTFHGWVSATVAA